MFSSPRVLYWVACNKCDYVGSDIDLGEIIRLFAYHERSTHNQDHPHYPEAGCVPLKTR